MSTLRVLKNALRLFLLVQPAFALAAYAVWLAGYAQVLDYHLAFIPPASLGPPEDVLGFGFWFTWILLLAWFVPGWLVGFRGTSGRRAAYWYSLAGLFALFSALDFFLYRTLESQVIPAG